MPHTGGMEWQCPVPSRGEARRMVVAVGLFWIGCAGMVGVGMRVPGHPAFVLLPFSVGFAALAVFYATLLELFRRDFGLSPWRMYAPLVGTAPTMAALWSLMRPRFLRGVISATGWPPAAVVAGLAAALASIAVVGLFFSFS